MTQIHDSTTCTCEMCRFAGDFEKSRSESPSEASELEKGQDEFLQQGGENQSRGDSGSGMAISVSCNFEHEWSHAPRAMTNYVEQSIAKYWYLRGVQSGRAEALIATNDDLRELLRVAKERIVNWPQLTVPIGVEMAELFTLEPDTRLEDLRNWIKFQWAFHSWFGCWWPTEAQIVTIAGWFKVLCETVIEECDAEFIRHCEEHSEEVS